MRYLILGCGWIGEAFAKQLKGTCGKASGSRSEDARNMVCH